MQVQLIFSFFFVMRVITRHQPPQTLQRHDVWNFDIFSFVYTIRYAVQPFTITQSSVVYLLESAPGRSDFCSRDWPKVIYERSTHSKIFRMRPYIKQFPEALEASKSANVASTNKSKKHATILTHEITLGQWTITNWWTIATFTWRIIIQFY